MTRLINPQDFSHAAGHERYSGMSKVYYKYAHGALIVFDLARPETFESALGWLSDVTGIATSLLYFCILFCKKRHLLGK